MSPSEAAVKAAPQIVKLNREACGA